MRRSATIQRAALALQIAVVLPSAACAQEGAPSWGVTPRMEYSDVSINGNDGQWRSASLMVDRRLTGGDSVFAVVQRQERNDASDTGLQLGGYARRAGWGAMASVDRNPGAVFLPQWGYEIRLDHAAGPNRRAGLGYRRLRYADSNIAILSPHVTFYRGNSEFAISYLHGRNPELDHDIRVVQLRALAVMGKNQFGAYLAQGDYIFDALGIAGTSGSGWSANLAFSRTLTPRTTLRLEVGQGRESDTFRQQSLAVSLRYTP